MQRESRFPLPNYILQLNNYRATRTEAYEIKDWSIYSIIHRLLLIQLHVWLPPFGFMVNKVARKLMNMNAKDIQLGELTSPMCPKCVLYVCVGTAMDQHPV